MMRLASAVDSFFAGSLISNNDFVGRYDKSDIFGRFLRGYMLGLDYLVFRWLRSLL